MLIKPCGETALLIDLTDANRKPLSAAMQLRLAIESASAAGELPGVTETIPAAATVLVYIDPRQISLQRAAELISALDLEAVAATTTNPGSHIEIPTVYTGPDLEPLANRLQLSPQQLIALHGEITWTAAFGGFAPGFMYLVSQDFPFTVPRLASPRAAIPAGSVALAGGFSAVYPQQSPGGWQLIGHTEVVMWDTQRPQPSLVQPGDTVRFVNQATV